MVVNFHPELRVLTAEAHYLDRKGFVIPPLALQVALQQGEYRAWTEDLERLLQLHDSVSVNIMSSQAWPFMNPLLHPAVCQRRRRLHGSKLTVMLKVPR